MKPEDTIVKFDNGGIIDGNKSFVFGPCSVESQEQVDAVAQDLQAKGEKFIRGGAFKRELLLMISRSWSRRSQNFEKC